VADEPEVEDAIPAAEAEMDLEPETLLAIAAPAADTDEPDEAAAATLAPASEPMPLVHAVDPETDDLAAAAAAQTHGLLDKFRARPELPSPAPIASTPIAPIIEMPTQRPVPTPVVNPQPQLPYAAIGPQADPTVPQPFGFIGRPSAPSPQPYGDRVAMPYAAATGLPYSAPDAPIQPYPAPTPAHPAPTPAMHPPFQPGSVAPASPSQAQYATPPAPPSFATPPTYPALQPQYPAPPPAPSWRMVAPESPYLAPAPGAQGYNAPPHAAGPEPQWPTTPSWPAPLARGAEAVWAESTRDLLSRPEAGVSACFNCGLPLSATARFCRRCGTSQVSS
jgi:hypothetical protein